MQLLKLTFPFPEILNKNESIVIEWMEDCRTHILFRALSSAVEATQHQYQSICVFH